MRSADSVLPARVAADAAATGAAEHAVADPALTLFKAATADFLAGLDQLGEEFVVEDLPAPRRLAPHAAATAVTVYRDGAEVASGRLVLLYDPAGQEAWAGEFRVVAFVRADIEPEVAADPLLAEVGWSWLTEALDAHVPGYAAESGTVTRTITEGFGGKEEEDPLTDFELRASWTPTAEPASRRPGAQDGVRPDVTELELGSHVAAWCACIAAAAGLEPPGTRAIRPGTQRPGAV
jgi:Protein of unknown function (DUF3000)